MTSRNYIIDDVTFWKYTFYNTF